MGLKGEAFTVVALVSILPSSTIHRLMANESEADVHSMTLFVFSTNLVYILTLPIALALLLPS